MLSYSGMCNVGVPMFIDVHRRTTENQSTKISRNIFCGKVVPYKNDTKVRTNMPVDTNPYILNT